MSIKQFLFTLFAGPVLVAMFMFGWFMYNVGELKRQRTGRAAPKYLVKLTVPRRVEARQLNKEKK